MDNFKRRSPFEREEQYDNERNDFAYQSSFQQAPNRKKQQNFRPRQQIHQYQNDFDELNASWQNEPTFNLYEDDTVQAVANNKSLEDILNPSSIEEDPSLDPTWFARHNNASNIHEENIPMRRMRSPRMEDRYDNTAVNSMQQNPYRNADSYPEAPAQSNSDIAFARHRREQATFGNQQNQATMPWPESNPMTQPLNSQDAFMNMQRNNNQVQNDPIDDGIEKTSQTTAFHQIRDARNRTQYQQRTQPQQRPTYHTEQSINDTQMRYSQMDRFDPFQEQTHTSAIPVEADIQMQKKQLRRNRQTVESDRMQRFPTSRQANDPFHYGNSNPDTNNRNLATIATSNNNQLQEDMETNNQVAIDARNVDTYASVSETRNASRTFVRQNLLIFIFTLIDAIALSVLSSRLVYTSFFNVYSSISSLIIPDIIRMALILALLITYLTAGTHAGYNIMKKSIMNWSNTVKILSFPIMLIVYLVIGAVCEIPYLIYNIMKFSNVI